MTRFAATIFALLLVPVCTSQTYIGRLFFQTDSQGGTPSVGEFEWRPTPDVRVFDNPDLLVEPGHVERLYLYWEFHLASLKIDGIDVDVRVSGDGTITGWHFYNANVGVQTRWNGVGNRAGNSAVQEITQVAMISVTQFGVVNSGTAASTDPHYNRNTEDGGSVRGTTLLGWVDLRLDGPNPSELFLDIGPALISRSNGPNDYVYFGFGDPAIRVAPRGNTSILFDARLRPVPEPAAVLLFGALLVFAGVSRRRGIHP